MRTIRNLLCQVEIPEGLELALKHEDEQIATAKANQQLTITNTESEVYVQANASALKGDAMVSMQVCFGFSSCSQLFPFKLCSCMCFRT